MIYLNHNLKKGYNRYNHRLSNGFTLLEVLIAIFILGVGLTLMATIFRGNSDINIKGRDLVVGSLLGQTKMEELIQRGFNDLVKGSKTFKELLSFYEEGKIVNDKYRWSADIVKQEKDLLKLQVQVVWPWPVNKHHIEYSTLLTRKTDD